MLEIAHKIWEKGQIPDKCKEATMVPILKKDKLAKDPTSYCPIYLLPVGNKIVETQPVSRRKKAYPLITDQFQKRT